MQYDATSGALLYKGVRYLLIRPETIVGFQKAIAESCGHQAEDKLFEGGFKGGRLSASKYREEFNFSNPEIVKFMMRMGNQIGWGNFTLKEYDQKAKRLAVVVTHSPFAQAYGASSHGVCHLIRGVLAGMGSVLFESDCGAEEKTCRAKGDADCLFVVEAD